jgi:hypothetical protein
MQGATVSGLINLAGIASAVVDQYSNADRDAVSLVIGAGLLGPVVYILGLGIAVAAKKLFAWCRQDDELLGEAGGQPACPTCRPTPARRGTRHA